MKVHHCDCAAEKIDVILDVIVDFNTVEREEDMREKVGRLLENSSSGFVVVEEVGDQAQIERNRCTGGPRLRVESSNHTETVN